jgi:S-layer family protein
MMNKLALLAGAVALMAFARPAMAQGPFADVPTDHWAYDAVNELAQRGIVNGYPDSTFGGKRALTRYEFAVAIQRMLQDVQRRIDEAIQKHLQEAPHTGAPGAPPPPGDFFPRAEGEQLRRDVDQLRRLTTEFQDTLAALGTDVDQIKRDLAALSDRLRALEDTVRKMPKITGAATTFAYGSYISSGSLQRAQAAPAGAGRATDIDNRTINQDNILDNARTVYDIDLGITARLSDVATARLLLNAGNYLGGYLNNSLSTVRDFGGTTFNNVRPIMLYIDTPVSVGSMGASIKVGKFGQQFTPYTLKMVDVDSYTSNDKTDTGAYWITGGQVNFKVGGVTVQAYAGQHNHDETPLTSTAGTFMRGRIGDRYFVGNSNVTDPNGVVAAALPAAALIDQSFGTHVAVGIPWKGHVGGTYLQGAGTAGKPGFRKLEVYGGDLSVQPLKWLRLEGEYAQSQWYNQANTAVGNDTTNDRTAWDGRLVIPIGKLELTGQYKRIGGAFDAPGDWGKIGAWFNPKQIEGYGGSLRYPFSNRLSLEGEGHVYTVIGARDNQINHYKAGIKFGLTSSNNVDLGAEWVDWDAAVGGTNHERYYNIGFGHDFSPNTSLKLLYQYIDYSAGNFPAVLPAFDYTGGVAVTQFSVRF